MFDEKEFRRRAEEALRDFKRRNDIEFHLGGAVPSPIMVNSEYTQLPDHKFSEQELQPAVIPPEDITQGDDTPPTPPPTYTEVTYVHLNVPSVIGVQIVSDWVAA